VGASFDMCAHSSITGTAGMVKADGDYAVDVIGDNKEHELEIVNFRLPAGVGPLGEALKTNNALTALSIWGSYLSYLPC